MMGVGYGDMPAHSNHQRLFAIVIQIMGAGMFGFIMAAIGAFLETHNPRALEAKKRMVEIREWLHGRELPRGLRLRLLDHFAYYTTVKAFFFEESDYVRGLPPQLKHAFLSQLHYDKIERFQFFHDLLGPTVCEICTRLTPFFAGNGEVLVNLGEVSRDFYFVNTGTVLAGYLPALDDCANATEREKKLAALSAPDSKKRHSLTAADLQPKDDDQLVVVAMYE